MGMNEGTGKGSEKRSDERPFHRYLSSFLGYSRLIHPTHRSSLRSLVRRSSFPSHTLRSSLSPAVRSETDRVALVPSGSLLPAGRKESE